MQAAQEKTPVELFRERLQAQLASNYAHQQSELVKRGMASRLAEGYSVTRPPLGYETTETRGLYRPNELGLEIGDVLRAFAKGHITEPLARYKLGSTILADTGKRLDYYQITNLLLNPYYAGLLNWNGETYYGCHQSLINIELYDEIFKKLESYLKATGRLRLPEKSEGTR